MITVQTVRRRPIVTYTLSCIACGSL